jgi:hypothetical protein
MDKMNISTASVTVAAMSSEPVEGYKNPGDVDFEVKYPENFKGQKLMPEGTVVISKESADQFEKMGIGQVVKPQEQKAVEPKKSKGKVE